VLDLLRRAEGASVAQVIEATGWQPHTVRGFLAGLKKRGLDLQVLERIRRVSPDKQGANGRQGRWQPRRRPFRLGQFRVPLGRRGGLYGLASGRVSLLRDRGATGRGDGEQDLSAVELPG
jgi:hypothetical protein